MVLVLGGAIALAAAELLKDRPLALSPELHLTARVLPDSRVELSWQVPAAVAARGLELRRAYTARDFDG